LDFGFRIGKQKSSFPNNPKSKIGNPKLNL
jgi:hypothetical protein